MMAQHDSFKKYFLSFALALAIVGNSFATFATENNEPATPSEMNAGERISQEQLMNVINQKLGSNRHNEAELLLRLIQKDESPDKAAKKDSQPNTFNVNIQKGNKYLFTTYTNPSNGQSVQFKESRQDLMAQSPGALVAKLGKMFSDSTLESLGKGNAKILGKNVTYYGATFTPSALKFYGAVGFNMFFNLYRDYDKDPMALQHFIDELKSPMGWVSFFAFTGGQAFAKNIFIDYIEKNDLNLSNPKLFMVADHNGVKNVIGRSGMPIGFLAMAFGSLASDFSADLINVAKPCANALNDPNKVEDDDGVSTPMQPVTNWQKCTAAFGEVMSSENGYKYLTSSTSAFISAILAAGISGGVKLGAAIPAKGIRMIFSKEALAETFRTGSKFLKSARVLKAFGGWAVETANLIIFLRAQDFVQPAVYHFVESKFNSGAKLSNATEESKFWLQELENKNWMNVSDYNCQKLIEDLPYAARGEGNRLLDYAKKEQELCRGPVALGSLSEKFAKWRTALANRFTSSYNNWVEFVANFKVMHDVSKEFFRRIVVYSAGINEKSNSYNYLVDDAPFYGVLNSEHVAPVPSPLLRDANNMAKAIRVTEAAPLINNAVQEVLRAKLQFSASDFVQQLMKAENFITSYKTQEDKKDFSNLVNTIKIINSLYESYHSAYLANMPVGDPQTYFVKKVVLQGYISEQKFLFSEIKKIRDYLGNPKPLKKGEAFIEDFNDWVKKDKSKFLPLFEEKGGPAQTITWYAVCHQDVNHMGQIDKREGSIYSFLDNMWTKITGSENHPIINFADAIKFGTAVDFYVPNIVNADTQEICDKNRPFHLDITPKSDYVEARLTPMQQKLAREGKLVTAFPDGKQYDSMFSFLIHNIKPEVLNLDAHSVNQFLNWWDKVVEPKTAEAYQRFTTDYFQLLNGTYAKILDGNLGRNNSGYAGLQEILDAPRESYGIASNLIQAYNDELTIYLDVLNRVYDHATKVGQFDFPMSNGPQSAMEVQQKIDKNHLVFEKSLTKLKGSIWSLLNDIRHYQTAEVAFIDPTERSNGMEASPSFDYLVQKYTKVLLNLTEVSTALGFKMELPDNRNQKAAALFNDPTSGMTAPLIAAQGLAYFQKNPSAASSAIPIQAKIQARLKGDEVMATAYKYFESVYNQAVLNKSLEVPYVLNYGIKGNVQAAMRPDGQVAIDTSHFSNSDELTMSYVAANQLFNLAEEIYFNLNVLKAASSDNNYVPNEKSKSAPNQLGKK